MQEATVGDGTAAAAAVDRLVEELTTVLFDAYPVYATVLGQRGWDDRLPDYSEAGDAALAGRVRAVAAEAEAVDAAALDAGRRLTRAVLLQQAADELDYRAARAVEYAVNDSEDGVVPNLFGMLSLVTIGESTHAEGYLARLAGLPAVLAAVADRHRAGIAAGRLPVADHVRALAAYLERYLASPVADPLRRPDPTASAPVDRAAFRAERDGLLAEAVRPAVAAYRDTLLSDVLPHGRPVERAGLCWLPNGEELYARLARSNTTLGHPPQHWHDTGLDVVDALAEEYAAIAPAALGVADLGEIFTRLRSDPALRWRDGEELLAAARAAVSRAEQAAGGWFGRLPSQSCAVEPIPAELAPGAAAGHYIPPALDGTRPGLYRANTHRASERPRHAAEVTAFHEAVPGHHFQLTLALELTDLPLLRRMPSCVAYVEGWGLYSERLADEMGLYSDDLARLGMLSADSLRAARLVVDTGLHAHGWSRQRARDYMRENTPIPVVEIDQETDRYINIPGQALAYMAGRLEIQRLRAEAVQRLGQRFDIRSFHDTVLGGGPLPLAVLGDTVQGWVTDRLTG